MSNQFTLVMKTILLIATCVSILTACATPQFGDDNYGYINQDYNKNHLINGKFDQSVQAMNTSPYTWQGENYEESGIEDNSPFMNGGGMMGGNIDDGAYPDSAYLM
jgi:uncharacterized protein YxeA